MAKQVQRLPLYLWLIELYFSMPNVRIRATNWDAPLYLNPALSVQATDNGSTPFVATAMNVTADFDRNGLYVMMCRFCHTFTGNKTDLQSTANSITGRAIRYNLFAKENIILAQLLPPTVITKDAGNDLGTVDRIMIDNISVDFHIIINESWTQLWNWGVEYDERIAPLVNIAR